MTLPAGTVPLLPLLRARVLVGARRWRTVAWSVGQSALAGATGWELAVRVLHHTTPFYAAVAAIVCLGTSNLNRVRRVGELAAGVSVGVGVADLVVHRIGHGGWQIALVVALTMTVALLLDGGTLIVNQAALQAVFVVVLPAPSGGYLSRWLDAIVGGATALAVAFVLPADPRPALRRESTAVTATMAAALRQAAGAARAGDPDLAAAALDAARGTEPALGRWRDAVRAGEEITRLSPLRRGAWAEISSHRLALVPVDRAVRNLRVALRRVVAATEDAVAGGEPLPEPVLEVLEQLGGTLHTLPGALLDRGGEGGRRTLAALQALSGRLDPQALQAHTLSATVVVAQVRSSVVDLLHVPGVSAAGARGMLPG